MPNKIPLKQEPLKSLVINRRRWGRGASGGKLLNTTDNKMCCLGFMARACKVPRGLIENVAMPDGLPFVVQKSSGKGLMVNTEAPKNLNREAFSILLKGGDSRKSFADRAAGFNDDELTSDAVKEKKITKLFKSVGIDVTFTN